MENRSFAFSLILALAFLALPAQAGVLIDTTFSGDVNSTWNFTADPSFTGWFANGTALLIKGPATGAGGNAYCAFVNQTNASVAWSDFSNTSTNFLEASMVFRATNPANGDRGVGFGFTSMNGTYGCGSAQNFQVGHLITNDWSTGTGAGQRFDSVNASAFNFSGEVNTTDLFGNTAYNLNLTDYGGTGACAGPCYTTDNAINATFRIYPNGTAFTTYSYQNGTAFARFSYSYLLDGDNPLSHLTSFSPFVAPFGDGATGSGGFHQVYRYVAYLNSYGGAPVAGACSDTTSPGLCSTVNPSYFCDNSTTPSVLVYNPTLCACPDGYTTNGTACVVASLQPKVQVPVGLTVWSSATCPTLTGRSCIGTVCSPSYSDCNYVASGLDSLNPAIVGTRIYARYTATSARRVITTEANVANSIRVTSASCTASSTDTSLLPDGNMTFDTDTGAWVSANINLLANTFGQSFPTVTVTCDSSVGNSQIYASTSMRNTPPWEVNVQPIAVAGEETALTDSDNLFAQATDYSGVESLRGVNRVTTQESPLLFRYFTRPPVSSGVSSTLDTFLNTLFAVTTLGTFQFSQAPSTYTAPACLLTFYNSSTFASPGEVPYSGLLQTTTAPKTDVLLGGATVYGKSVLNNVKQAGDYPYTFTCTPANGVGQPGIASRESLTVNKTCSGSDLSSDLKVDYLYGSSGQKTNLTGQFFYGVPIQPSVTYRTLNGTGTFLNSVGDCLWTVSNSSGNLATFQKGVSASIYSQPSVIRDGRYVFSGVTFPFAEGYLPVGSYTFTFTCDNRDRSFCSATATLVQNVSVNATAGGCLGTSDSCGLGVCSTPCPDDTFRCEDGATVLAQQACIAQACTSARSVASVGSDICREQGHELYTVKLALDKGADYVCDETVTMTSTVLANGTAFLNANGTCKVSVDLGRQTSADVPMVNGRASFSFKTGGTQSRDIACGRTHTAAVSCDSSTFGSTKTDAVSFSVGADTKCAYGDTTVRAGCAWKSTGKDSDKGKLCLSSGAVIDDPLACGCPSGFEVGNQTFANSTTYSLACVRASSSKTLTGWLDGIWSLSWVTGGLLFFLIFVAPFLGQFIRDLTGR